MIKRLPASSGISGLCRVTELTGSSQPHRLLKVTLAFNTWNRGISAGQGDSTPQTSKNAAFVLPLTTKAGLIQTCNHLPAGLRFSPTYFNWEAWRQTQGDEVTQLGKVGVWNCHEVYDGGHLLSQGQRMSLTQPQRRFKPKKRRRSKGRKKKKGQMIRTIKGESELLFTTSLYFCTLLVSSVGRPMSRPFRLNSGSKYSSAVMAVGLWGLAHCDTLLCEWQKHPSVNVTAHVAGMYV